MLILCNTSSIHGNAHTGHEFQKKVMTAIFNPFIAIHSLVKIPEIYYFCKQKT